MNGVKGMGRTLLYILLLASLLLTVKQAKADSGQVSGAYHITCGDTPVDYAPNNTSTPTGIMWRCDDPTVTVLIHPTDQQSYWVDVYITP